MGSSPQLCDTPTLKLLMNFCDLCIAESGAFAAMHLYTIVIFAINYLAELFVISLFATALFLTVVADDMVGFQALTRHVVCTSKWKVKIILD